MNNCFFYWVVLHVLNSHRLSMGKSQEKFQLGKVSHLFRVRPEKIPCSLSWMILVWQNVRLKGKNQS